MKLSRIGGLGSQLEQRLEKKSDASPGPCEEGEDNYLFHRLKDLRDTKGRHEGGKSEVDYFIMNC